MAFRFGQQCRPELEGANGWSPANFCPHHPELLRGRANGLSPPYSPQSQCAAVLVLLLSGGVLCAHRLPPTPLFGEVLAFHVWGALAIAWLPILAWLLVHDSRAKLPSSRRARVTRCQYGCSFASAPRTKHCRRCDKCIAGFDHHCLWLNTCIGTQNYRPWMVFVILLFNWSVLGSGISWSTFFRAMQIQSRLFAVGHRPTVFLTGLGTTVIAAWLFFLLALHMYLACARLTTLEWIKSGSKLPRIRNDECFVRPFAVGSLTETTCFARQRSRQNLYRKLSLSSVDIGHTEAQVSLDELEDL